MNARLYAIYDGSIHDATIATTEEIRKEPCKVRQVKVRLLMLYVETSLREASQSVVNTVNTLNDKTVSAARWCRLSLEARESVNWLLPRLSVQLNRFPSVNVIPIYNSDYIGPID